MIIIRTFTQLFDYFSVLELSPPGMVFIKGITNHISYMRNIFFPDLGNVDFPIYNRDMNIYDFNVFMQKRNIRFNTDDDSAFSDYEDGDNYMNVSEIASNQVSDISDNMEWVSNENVINVVMVNDIIDEYDEDNNHPHMDDVVDDEIIDISSDESRHSNMAGVMNNAIMDVEGGGGDADGGVIAVNEDNMLGDVCENCAEENHRMHVGHSDYNNLLNPQVADIANTVNLHRVAFRQNLRDEIEARRLNFSTLSSMEKMEYLKISLLAMEIAIAVSNNPVSKLVINVYLNIFYLYFNKFHSFIYMYTTINYC